MHNLVINPLMRTLEYQMDGLALRNETIADNIANASTPGFRSRRVDFERNLRAALREGDAAPDAEPAVDGGMDLMDSNGNSVRLEGQMTDMAKNSLAQQMAVNSFNYKIGIIRTAVTSRSA